MASKNIKICTNELHPVIRSVFSEMARKAIQENKEVFDKLARK